MTGLTCGLVVELRALGRPARPMELARLCGTSPRLAAGLLWAAAEHGWPVQRIGRGWYAFTGGAPIA
jgi:hypothetical protein